MFVSLKNIKSCWCAGDQQSDGDFESFIEKEGPVEQEAEKAAGGRPQRIWSVSAWSTLVLHSLQYVVEIPVTIAELQKCNAELQKCVALPVRWRNTEPIQRYREDSVKKEVSIKPKPTLP